MKVDTVVNLWSTSPKVPSSIIVLFHPVNNDYIYMAVECRIYTLKLKTIKIPY